MRSQGAAVAVTDAVLVTAERSDLTRASEAIAVVHTPAEEADWTRELADALDASAFELPRAILPAVTRDEAAEWLAHALPRHAVSPTTREALVRDVLALIDLQASLTRGSRFRLRAFAEPPTRRCGFHVDTVPPRHPTVGVLKVYNGEGTLYVDPTNVASTRAFYAYLQRRERLGRELTAAAGERGGRYAELVDEVLELDERPPFVLDPHAVAVVPAGSTVAFRHLDVREHWSSHPPDRAWIHRSPAEGGPRLVVNVSPAEGYPRAARS